MGISKMVGLAAATLFLASICLKLSRNTLIMVPILFDSLIASLVAVASHNSVNFPLILGKNSDGRFPLWSKLIFAPFLLLVRAYVYVRRLKSKEPVYNEISEGLYVGGWPYSLDQLPPGGPAVIDCTCELPRSSFIPKDEYLCIATWDTRSPSPSQIESAVRWACRKRAERKPIYVHCAFGHGRSVCIMSALLVALGLADNWKEAEKIIREKRPKIRMNVLHRRNLEEWSKYRLSSKTG
ncbi:uncharacterized protein LOC109722835 [Ananas comosus]|uniref:Uncharacterized protein LOC109722835 n=1 Tax=Ananas comosus TaxID=4615 RepID=A0A6P5GKJ6_ANACO|nr:uncharacterized protein LOC109722835 [Ananas comosus]XP_020106582.1 uncharacterized protein LOC109722835 [Ananas comosus]XP_020106583.1 uncharacterized protein LOC109722835 [Ananas comosus]XP_020106585.1 uncharacterized protein LOC109722835 [Ananas comosus]